jgi:sulfopyruvate decarboxylase alpha subunit
MTEVSMKEKNAPSEASHAWPHEIHKILKKFDVRQVAYVPDAGHAELIRQCHADNDIAAITLTTEEEGLGVLTGAWLGGQRGVLLMQSSGVGNCANMLSLVKMCRIPMLILVTMRGEWGEFNSWQVSMGTHSEDLLKIGDIKVLRAETAGDVLECVNAAAAMTFDGATACAVLISQRAIGSKKF